jgi:hypothetical protein
MNKVKVCRFRKYDVTTDENQVSKRWATREAIERIGGEEIIETETEVDPSAVGRDIAGMTARGFDPNRGIGFQTQVTTAPRAG